MRKPLAYFLLLVFIGTMPLQAYAQACALHCAMMAADMQQESSAASTMHGTPDAHDHAAMHHAPDEDKPCVQTLMCQLTQGVQLLMLPERSAGIGCIDSSSPPQADIKPLLSRYPPPLDRPPIFS